MKILRLVVAIWLPALAGCYLFCDDNRPCDKQGRCLPGYTCVEGLCVKEGVKSIGDECLATGECEKGAVCAEAYCDDSERKPCDNDDDCGDKDKYICYNDVCKCIRLCRKACDFPDFSACDSGHLCYLETEEERGFCQQGNCGEEIGACPETEVCLEFNGPGSGLCNPMCTILEQELGCREDPVPDGVLCCAANENCEHYELLWDAAINPYGDYGICFQSGTKNEGEPCSNSVEANAFCRPGMVCTNNVCRKYCNLAQPGQAPACDNQYPICTPLTSTVGLPYGLCMGA